MTPEMPATGATPPPGTATRRKNVDALRVTMIYAAFAGMWVLLSDKLVELLFSDPVVIYLAGTLKGWVFVGVTAVLLYRLIERGQRSEAQLAQPLVTPSAIRYWLLAIIVATILALTGRAVIHIFDHYRDREVARLQAIADLKSRQVADWLKERHGDATILQTAAFLGMHYRRWRDTNDLESRDMLVARLNTFRRNDVYRSVLLLDEEGNTVWDSEGGSAPVSDVLRSAALKAAAARKSGQVGPYSDEKGRLTLDFLTFWPAQGGRSGPLVVLRVDPGVYLFPTLQAWPVPSTTGEALLVRHDGEQLVFLNELRHRKDTAGALRLPADSGKLLAARFLRGEGRENTLIEGIDYRDVAVMGFVRSVPGTDWLLVAKMDREEVYSGALRDSVWVVLAGTLAIFLAMVATLLLRQRRYLNLWAQEREAQNEKMRAFQLLDAIANGSTDAIFAKDRDGRYLLFNRQAARVTGKSAEDVLGHDDTVLFPPEQAAQVMANDREVITTGNMQTLVETLDTVDGKVTFLATKGPLYDAEGVLIGLFGISRDITERQRMEDSLRESQARHQLILESAAEGFWMIDAERRTVEVNGALCRMLGYSRDEMLGRRPTDFVDAANRTVFQAQMSRIATTPHRHYEIELTRQDGTQLPAYFQATTHFDDEGGTAFSFAFVTDLTARKVADTHNRKLSMAVEQSPESIVITGVDGNIEYVNEAFVRTTGYSRAESIGRNPSFLHSGKTPAASYQALWTALQQGLSWRGEFTNQRKDGSEYTEFASVTPIRQENGQITHYVAVKEDITEKKRIGRELDQHRHHLEELVLMRTVELAQAKIQAEGANRAKSEFLANMSHEIRTPMNAIIGLTHLLQRGAPRPEQSDRLDKIDRAASHLLSIINGILDLSKIEADRLVLEQVDFSLADVLAHTYWLVAEPALAKGLQLEVDGGSVPLWLRGDPTRLSQALLNYASNAVKFTESGAIAILAQVLEDDGERVYLRFEVRDTGIGIGADELPRLFRAFQQADQTTTRKYGGTGLGLTITRQLAQLMGGEAGVSSEPGQGSTFWFTAWFDHGQGLMPSNDTHQDIDVEAELRHRHTGARVLLAEDNPVNREVATDLLDAVGLLVDTADDGRQAVDKASANTYDLILMDLQMPKLDGLAATQEIRALPRGQAMPIIAMTANAFDEDRRNCLAGGMNDFVPKPVDPKVLYGAILRWLPVALPVEAIPVEVPAPSDSNDDQALRARLAGIPGLDLDAVLETMRGKVAKVARLLGMFADGHEHDIAKLSQWMANGEFQSIEMLAHTLKGSAGNIKATAVSLAAAALLDAVRRKAENPEIVPLHADLARELSAFLTGIRIALSETDRRA